MSRRSGPLAENRSAPPERVIVAAKLLSEMRPTAVRQALMEQFDIGLSSAKRAITMARHLMREHEQEMLPEIRAVTVARLDKLIDSASSMGDFRSAIRGIHEVALIYGLHKPDELNINIGPRKEALAKLTDAQLAALAALEEAEEAVRAEQDPSPTEH